MFSQNIYHLLNSKLIILYESAYLDNAALYSSSLNCLQINIVENRVIILGLNNIRLIRYETYEFCFIEHKNEVIMF